MYLCCVDSPIPHLHSEIEVSVFHRGVLSDDFLGYATIPLWEQKIQDKPKSQSVPVFVSSLASGWSHGQNKLLALSEATLLSFLCGYGLLDGLIIASRGGNGLWIYSLY